MIAHIGARAAKFAIVLPRLIRTLLPVTTLTTAHSGETPAPEPDYFGERDSIRRAVAGIAVYAGVFGLAFGAVAAAAGLSVLQAVVLSAVMFTGASQFALVGILGVGGSPFAALAAALLLGTRNAFYGVPVSGIVRPRGLGRLLTAHLVIDETTAMAVAQRDAARRPLRLLGDRGRALRAVEPRHARRRADRQQHQHHSARTGRRRAGDLPRAAVAAAHA